MESGMDFHFYRAMKKYGIDDLESEILEECENNEHAQNSEKLYIEKYDTFKNGYNMTKGGDGGNIVGLFKGNRRKNWIESLRSRAEKEKNPNYSGYSDNELIDLGVQCYLENRKFTIKKWQRFAKDKKAPQTFSKNRFGGKIKNFKEKVFQKLIELNYNPLTEDFIYKKTNEHKRKLSEAIQNKRWFNNGIENKYINENEVHLLDKKWKRGRTKK